MIMSQKLEKVIRDGKVAVLYSPGFGAGWSTWNSSNPALVFDPVVVTWIESGRKGDILPYLEEKYDGYFGGLDGLTIEWLPIGTLFQIEEHDGSESISSLKQTWICA
jgi:hypothetical protein